MKERLSTLKAQLGISMDDETLDEQVQFALDSAIEAIQIYCNIEDIPVELNNTLIRMAMSIYRNEKPGDADNPQTVKSISVGDTSTSFGDSTTQSFRDSLLADYKKQLNRYRKVLFR